MNELSGLRFMRKSCVAKWCALIMSIFSVRCLGSIEVCCSVHFCCSAMGEGLAVCLDVAFAGLLSAYIIMVFNFLPL